LKLTINILSKIRESYSVKAFDYASSKTSAKVLDMIAINMFMNTTATRKVESKNINIIDLGSVPLVYGPVSIFPKAPKLYTDTIESIG
jgi:hypothetical protein